MAVALAAENSATNFYRQLANSETNPGLRAVYEEFVELESRHASWLEERVAELQRRAGRFA